MAADLTLVAEEDLMEYTARIGAVKMSTREEYRYNQDSVGE